MLINQQQDTKSEEKSTQDQELNILIDEAKIFAPASNGVQPITDQSN